MLKRYPSKFLLILIICSVWTACQKKVTQEAPIYYPIHTKMDTAVLLVLGQSNAANFGESTYTAKSIGTYNFYLGNFYPLADPLLGAKGTKGSVWSRLGDSLIQKGFAKVVIISPVAIGGTTLAQWKPGGINNHLIVEAIQALQAKALTITHVLWHQGESDNTIHNIFMSAADNAIQYRNGFLELVSQIRSLGVQAPIFTAIATQCSGMPADTMLQKAQRGLSNDTMNIYNGPNTDSLGAAYRFDGCHFSNQGLLKHASMWSDILFAH